MPERARRSPRKRSLQVRPAPAPPENLADFPEIPVVETSDRRVRVVFRGVTVAESRRPLRLLERGRAPRWFLPPDDVRQDLLVPAPGSSVDARIGYAVHRTVSVGGGTAYRAAWSYPAPRAGYAQLKEHVAFSPVELEVTLDGDPVRPEEGHDQPGWLGGLDLPSSEVEQAAD